MEITRLSKLLDVLEAFPYLESEIIRIAPPFKNLQNPVLRRTVGKLATIEQVAGIGGLDAVELVNTLRRAASQPELNTEPHSSLALPGKTSADPDWIAAEPQFTINGSELLRQGEVPLQHVTELLQQLLPGRFLVLLTVFEPSPILDAMQKQGRLVHLKRHPSSPGQYLTYIQ